MLIVVCCVPFVVCGSSVVGCVLFAACGLTVYWSVACFVLCVCCVSCVVC